MKKHIFYIFLLMILTSQLLVSQANQLTMYGEIYRQDTGFTDLIYTQKEFVTGDYNNGIIQHIFYNKENQIKALESVELLDNKITNYDFKILDFNILGNLKQKDNKLIITRILNGKEKQKELELKNNIVVGPMLPQYIETNLIKIKNGESLLFFIPYFDMLTLIEMEIVNMNSGSINEIDVEMRLNNPILGFLLPAVKMTLDNNGKIIIINGPTILPDPAKPNSKKRVNTEILYKYGDLK